MGTRLYLFQSESSDPLEISAQAYLYLNILIACPSTSHNAHRPWLIMVPLLLYTFPNFQAEWDTVTKIGYKAHQTRATTVKGNAAVNAAARTGTLQAEKKFTGCPPTHSVLRAVGD